MLHAQFKNLNKYTIKLVCETRKKYTLPDDISRVRCSADVPDMIRAVFNVKEWHNEKFGMIGLDTQNNVISIDIMHEGTINQSIVYPREIVTRALLTNAASVILFHNHPSGSLKPSKADLEVTERLVKALETIDISVHDHIILTRFEYVSFSEKGLL